MIFYKNKYIYLILLISLCAAKSINAQVINLDASKSLSRAEVLLSPRSATFVVGSTFDIPILLNTKGGSINGIEIRLNYDKNKLAIIQPSGGKSIVGIWVEPPKYNNTNGTASYVGVIPDGIVTNSGLIGTITFKALSTGSASVSIASNSRILLNNGLGSEAYLNTIKAEYVIIPKAPEGLNVFSETHAFQDNWYNNKNPIFSWNNDENLVGFSFELDNIPSTIPDNIIDSKETVKSYQDLSDGLWYFHIKGTKNNIWGTTGHFLIKIDTAPPADFKPTENYIVAAASFVERVLISFFTTDNLSGVDHYEVGIIDKNQPTTESPVFIESDSPFQVPIKSDSNLKVIVRAVDKANNVRDVSIDIKPPLLITKFIKDYSIHILSLIIAFGFIGSLLHYLFAHHIIKHFKKKHNK